MAIRTKYIGYAGTATLLLLIAWFVNSIHFDVKFEGDKTCAGTYGNPCEWNYNVTLVTVPAYYIYNKNSIDLVFLPDVKEVFHCKKDGRFRSSKRLDRSQYPCGVGWREFDWKTPLTSRYKYINKFIRGKKQEFKIVVFKYNPEDVIKFGGEITKEEFDPFFLGTDLRYNIVTSIGEMKSCKNFTKTVYSKCIRQTIHYYNYTHFSNKTAPESKTETIYVNQTYECNPVTVLDRIICKTTGFKRNGVQIRTCPNDYKCGIYGRDYCEQSCNDGDCNYNLSENKGWGWTSNCVSYTSLR